MKKNGLDVVSTGMLRAQSFSIQVSDRVWCNARCKFCISRTTPHDKSMEGPKTCEESRLRVGLELARRMGATHAIFTGKADPAQEDKDYIYSRIRTSREYLPLVDMHTNGWALQMAMKTPSLEGLVDAGLTMITFSIASFDPLQNKKLMGIEQNAAWLIAEAKRLGLLVRCSLVVNKQGVSNFNDIMTYIKVAGDMGVHMVVVREVWIPDMVSEFSREVYDWNVKNKVPIKPFEDAFKRAASRANKHGISQRDPLPWGTPVFAVGGIFSNQSHGVNVTFARCDEATRGPVIKSIVHKPNGHGYRNWDHEGDILY